MSPETGKIKQHNIMAEAEMISERLTEIQASRTGCISREEAAELSGLRQEFGYDAVEAIDTSDAVDINIEEKIPVITPARLESVLPLTAESMRTTQLSRYAIQETLNGRSSRMIVIAGPCSIHSPESAIEYASHIQEMREAYGERMEIIMRFYPEKPRTELGWKGMIYDPRLDNSNDINLGVTLSRMLACQITAKGVPVAMERLNAYTPQYFNGLVAYDAVGARNTADQKAREYGSGTSSPVGFKNTTDGNILTAVEAVKTANAPHVFLGMNMDGLPMQVVTKGNKLAHVILRGGEKTTNFDSESVENTRLQLAEKDLLQALIVDASHGNSYSTKSGSKNYLKQIEVVANIARQIKIGQVVIKGVMLESNICEGKQPFVAGETDPATVKPDISITDACLSIQQTRDAIELLYKSL